MLTRSVLFAICLSASSYLRQTQLATALEADAAGNRPQSGHVTHMTAAGSGLLKLIPFSNSAFPYEGSIPDESKPFLDVISGDRRGHTSPRGGIIWADQAYTDRRTLLYVPGYFNPDKPAYLIVFFHGNLATLERDVAQRQRVPQQLNESGLNAVLVAPQLAIDALDSSAGHFWEPGFFAKYVSEAALHLSEMCGVPKNVFDRMPIIIVAYSGGYLPAIFSLEGGGAAPRVRGIILLDALFGEAGRYAQWLGSHWPKVFFLSAYSLASDAQNARLRSLLDVNQIAYQTGLPASLQAGTVAFISSGADINHNDFVTRAWTAEPLRVILSEIR